MPKLPVIASKELYALLIKYSCIHVRTAKSSHFIIENTTNKKRTAIPIHGGKDIGKGLFTKILKELDIDINEFLEFIKNN